jgi:hypothetical protein
MFHNVQRPKIANLDCGLQESGLATNRQKWIAFRIIEPLGSGHNRA